MSNWANNEEIQFFQEYLRIPSVHPDINYGKIIALFLKIMKMFTFYFLF